MSKFSPALVLLVLQVAFQDLLVLQQALLPHRHKQLLRLGARGNGGVTIGPNSTTSFATIGS
jgi:hypothetical protein